MYRVLPPYWEFEEFLNLFKKLCLGDIIEGKEIELFRNELSKILQTKNVELTNSGRVAIYAALSSLNLGKNYEVIVPSFVCEEVIRPILQTNLKLRFVDIKEDLTIDPNSIISHISDFTKVIIMPHIYGKVCDYKEIRKIASENNLVLIDDSAPVLGYRVEGKALGTFGDFGIYSMNNKSLYSIYGGILVYKEKYKSSIKRIMKEKCYQDSKNLVRYGFLKCVSRIGYKLDYHKLFGTKIVNRTFQKSLERFKIISIDGMSNITASIGLIQFKKYNEIMERRKKNSKVIKDILEDSKYFSVVEPKINDFYIRLVIQINKEVSKNIRKNPHNEWKEMKKFRVYLFKKKIETLQVYTPIHLDFFKMNMKLPNTERLWKKCVIVPNNPVYDEKDMKYIGETIKKYENQL